MHDDPLLKFIAPVAGVVLAVVLSVLLAAWVAGQIGDDYASRVWLYGGAVVWVLVGAVTMFMLAHRGETQPLSLRRVLLWTLTIWLWPVFAGRLVQQRHDGGS
jgi:hypothetical protein